MFDRQCAKCSIGSVHSVHFFIINYEPAQCTPACELVHHMLWIFTPCSCLGFYVALEKTSSTLFINCTLHTAHCTPQCAHCNMHTAHWKLKTARYTLHTTQCTLKTAYCTLHTSYCTIHTVPCTLHLKTSDMSNKQQAQYVVYISYKLCLSFKGPFIRSLRKPII